MNRTAVLVGRDRELRALLDQLSVAEPAAEAVRSHVVLAGDAGVGKTRLLVELGARAEAAGWRVCVGHCLDLGESAVPYLPFSEVLGRLDAALPATVEESVRAAPELAGLRPGAAREASPPAPRSGGTDRGGLFEGVRRLLERAAAQAPLLVVVEDVHWADHSTRDLLTYLLARPLDGPVAVVVSYRADDLHRRHPLRRQVAEWARLPGVTRTVLAPLPEDAVRTLVAELGTTAEAAIDAAQREEIVRRAEGNAFFVEELVSAASGPDHWLPDELADVLLVRLDRLDERARQVVRTASAAGRRVSDPLLAEVTGLAPAELDAALRAAVDANVLVPLEGGYAFRHALLAEAVHDDLLPGERVRLHARYAAALRASRGRGAAAELARHARLAHDLPTALAASVRAGHEAMELGGPDEAALHFEAALGLLAEPETAAAVEEPVDAVELAVAAADALLAVGQAKRAAILLSEQVDRLPREDRIGRARLLAVRATSLMMLESGQLPLEVSAAAVAELPADAPAPHRAAVLGTRARILADFRQVEEAESVGLEALAVAERHDLQLYVSEIVTTLSGLKRPGPQRPLRAALQDAVARARVSGAVLAELRGRFMLGRSYEDHGETDEAYAWFAGAVRLAEEQGIPWAPFALDSRWRLLAIRCARGEWDGVDELVDVPGAPATARALLEASRLEVRQARGDDVTDQAAALRRHWPDEGAVAIVSAALEMVAAGRRGDPAAVVAAYDDAVESLSRIWTPGFSATVRLAAVAIGELAGLLPDQPAVTRAGLLSEADRLRDAGRRVLARVGDASGHWGPEGVAWGTRLEAEALRLRWVADVDPPERDVLLAGWREVVDRFEAYGHVHHTATARVTYAEVLRAAGDTAGAREQADLARAAARRLGAQPLLDRLRALGSSPRGRATDAPSAGEALTPRETEILRLVAAGRTNGEIGRQLYISPKTVSVHVSRILGKLGAAGRTEAAAIARRQGLLG